MRLSTLELCCCNRSSLKSPKITHGLLDIDTWFNNLDNAVINAAVDTLGDLYNNATCMRLASGNTRV